MLVEELPLLLLAFLPAPGLDRGQPDAAGLAGVIQ